MRQRKPRQYLGTPLDPVTFYQERSRAYSNPHAVGIEAVLGKLRVHLTGKILDLGCGDGLATKLLGGDCIGCDQSSEMVSRYHQETGCPGYVRTFWDELPLADSAIAIYSLHLCEPSRMSSMRRALSRWLSSLH